MEPRRFDVAVVGELNPDLILSGSVMPEFGQVEKLVDEASLVIGSSSAIFACGAARLGLRVSFCGKVGNDQFGSFIRQSLEDRGVDTSSVVIDENNATGISVILSTGNDRAILTYPGTIPLLRFQDINFEIIKQARHMHLGSYYLLKGLCPDVPQLFRAAHELGLSVSLDTNYDPAGKWVDGIEEVLECVDVFLPNQTECLSISGMSDLDQAVEKLARKIDYLGVKLGVNGALLCQAGHIFKQPSLPVKVVDTIGAGDSFDAGFIYGYLSNWEPSLTLKLATICGSLSTREAGGTGAQPMLEEARQYL